MRTSRLAVFVALAGFVAVGCRDDEGDRTNTQVDAGGGAGSLGSAGMGGSAGSLGTAGTGGSAGGARCPQCLVDLMSSCMPSGACVNQTTLGPPATSNVCWANNVKVVATTSQTLPPHPTETWKKPDGSICYVVESTSTAGGSSAITYKNAGGTVVATGIAGRIVCADGNEVGNPDNCYDGPDCTQGVCMP
jgi:hypothetical protein